MYEIDSACLVVDTGPWILDRKVMLPAGMVERIDTDDHRMYVDRTKDQIRDAPEYDPTWTSMSATATTRASPWARSRLTTSLGGGPIAVAGH
jgi:hypothetical protein